MAALTSIIDRPDLATVTLAGNDVLRYLHAVCTQHTLDLVPGDATQALLLSPKGKIEFAFRLAVLDDGVRLDAEAATAPALAERGHRVELLDGDEVRTNLCQGLGFSREDRDTNIARIGYVAGKLSKHGVAVLVAAISPYREARDRVRTAVDNFVEVYVAAPVSTCAERDVKGLYAKALAGEIKNFTGVSDPYEPPLDPEIVLHTEAESVDDSVHQVIAWLEANQLTAPSDR